ncbi:MAG: methyl-accepting chemotaxis protein [Clostridiales bacterium]|jgi:methyl-accepting chemotaxis protein|nr:methyl-accepting chemotaxis protein [Clostridiales bacterium]
MTWISRGFQNLKMSMKLFVSFGVLLALLLSIIVLNAFSQMNAETRYTNLIIYHSERKSLINQTWADFLNLRRVVTSILIKDNNDLDQLRASVEEAFTLVGGDLRSYEDNLNSDPSISAEHKAEFLKLSSNVSNMLNDGETGYKHVVSQIFSAAEKDNYEAASDYLQSASDVSLVIASDLESMRIGTANELDARNAALTVDANNSIKTSILFGALSAIVCAGLVAYISKSISNRLGAATASSAKLSEGIVDEGVQSEATDEIGVLGSRMRDAQHTLKEIIKDLNNMYEQHKAGEIDYFVNPGKYKGAFSQLINNVNDMVKSHIDMSKTALSCVGEIGAGNFTAQIQVYPGKKAFINKAIEDLRGNINNVSTEINSLIKASIDGNLSARADAEMFSGDWRVLIASLNELCDTIVNPLKEVLSVLREMSKGNMNAKVTGDYKGDFKEMKDAFNFTTSELSNYIGEIGNVLREIANANLDVTINGDFFGDFSQIKNAIIAVNERLNDMVSNIGEVTDQVSEGARSISQSGIQLANGASEQAGAVQELSSTVETVSQNTKTNSVNADSANKMSKDSMRSAQESSREMKQMLEAMECIKDSSRKISQIIKTIEDIAFQTNLLALNAAVEAARAGEHGKGFSIVAEEVRSLALRSQTAAKDTTALIEDAINRVNNGTAIAQATAGSLEEIVSHVTEISGLISVISQSSREQAEAVSQINIGLSQISNVATANAATSQESSAASEQLSNQAESLNSLISMFTLKRDRGNSDRSIA